jgi:3-hydroxyisobutyrate dehydrogenase-like beta-hydroxyacid dehydrogenase
LSGRPDRLASEPIRIGVVGLGNMGSALAGRLLDHGMPVDAWNRSPRRIDPLESAGARRRGSPDEVAADCAAVFLSLADDAATLAVATPGGNAREAWKDILVVNTSTVSPQVQDKLRQAYGERFVAAPILGAPRAVRDGSATFVVGAERLAVDALAGVWELFAGPLVVPDADRATLLKLLHNQMLLAGLPVIAETIRLARAAGLDDETLAAMLKDSPLMAAGLKNRLGGLFDPAHEGWFNSPLAAKDLTLFLDLASAEEFPVTEAARDSYLRVAAKGWGEADITAIVELNSDNQPPQEGTGSDG